MTTLREMIDEIRTINIEKGWRSAKGGPGDNTWGDYVALLHSEISEMLEAYRDWGLADGTGPSAAERMDPYLPEFPKPEGVGSEAADVLIRLLDMCDVFGLTPFDMDLDLADVSPVMAEGVSFGDRVAWLHRCASVLPCGHGLSPFVRSFAYFLRALVAVAETYEIDLAAEYARKIAYNRTRTFQHGGRTLANKKP